MVLIITRTTTDKAPLLLYEACLSSKEVNGISDLSATLASKYLKADYMPHYPHYRTGWGNVFRHYRDFEL